MTALIHGHGAVEGVELASQALFGKTDVRTLALDLLNEVFADVPSSRHDSARLGEVTLMELLVDTGLAQSRREAREFLGNGAVTVNGERVGGDRTLGGEDLLHGEMILLRRGKKLWHATRWH